MRKSKEIALGGLMAAVSIVIMCLGGMIPLMTYVCPVFGIIVGSFLLKIISKSGYIAWYCVVSILSLLLCPDKEAAAIFLSLGYYPLIRGQINKLPAKWLIKIVFFNVVILTLYWILLYIFGMQELSEEFREMGKILTAFTLFVGNLVFFMLDFLLKRLEHMKFKKRGA